MPSRDDLLRNAHNPGLCAAHCRKSTMDLKHHSTLDGFKFVVKSAGSECITYTFVKARYIPNDRIPFILKIRTDVSRKIDEQITKHFFFFASSIIIVRSYI